MGFSDSCFSAVGQHHPTVKTCYLTLSLPLSHSLIVCVYVCDRIIVGNDPLEVGVDSESCDGRPSWSSIIGQNTHTLSHTDRDCVVSGV